MSLGYDKNGIVHTSNEMNELYTLPSGYLPCEYIQSSGSQYIDTGIVVKTTGALYCKIQLLSTSGDQKFLGSYGNNGCNIGVGVLGTKWRLGGSGWNDNSISATTDITHLTFFSKKIYVNDNSVIVSYGSDSSSSSIEVFGTKYNTTHFGCGSIKVYNISYFESGKIVKNFIPAKRTSDNVLGLYDTVTNTFYTNQGSGSFTGPVNQNSTFRNYSNSLITTEELIEY